MYCIKCGVKLADTEKKCPLCNTVVFHPDFEQKAEQPLYPSDKMPKSNSGAKVLNGAIIILYLIPMLVCSFADWSFDGKMEWFGYVAGALIVSYIAFALPLWFKKPNPVIFVPCDFVATALYLLYINLITNGNWFMSFAFPVVGGLCLITCTVVTLMYYLRQGRLYVLGGAFIALGAFMLLIEFLIKITFGFNFVGWSIYPLVVLFLFGGLLIYLAINNSVREMLERKIFF
ncbi:MAG: hypothetical protein IIU65_00805 [Clostridia bacterium]|nr:hypothetical protein [Clostridia bacterium]